MEDKGHMRATSNNPNGIHSMEHHPLYSPTSSHNYSLSLFSSPPIFQLLLFNSLNNPKSTIFSCCFSAIVPLCLGALDPFCLALFQLKFVGVTSV